MFSDLKFPPFLVDPFDHAAMLRVFLPCELQNQRHEHVLFREKTFFAQPADRPYCSPLLDRFWPVSCFATFSGTWGETRAYVASVTWGKGKREEDEEQKFANGSVTHTNYHTKESWEIFAEELSFRSAGCSRMHECDGNLRARCGGIRVKHSE